MEIEEINSMLLEELLGISNKRLKYIFQGKYLDEDSSSTTSEENVDIISLDDVSDEELIINVEKDKPRPKKLKGERMKNVKIEKDMKKSSSTSKVDTNENLMSVLELLELQARARAIKSQLLIENAKTQQNLTAAKNTTVIEEKVGSDDDIIIETVKGEEIVIDSSDSEQEENQTEKIVADIVDRVTNSSAEKSYNNENGNEKCTSDSIKKKKTEENNDIAGEKNNKTQFIEYVEKIKINENFITGPIEELVRKDEDEELEVDNNEKIIIIENTELMIPPNQKIAKSVTEQTEQEDKPKDAEIIIINISDNEMEKID